MGRASGLCCHQSTGASLSPLVFCCGCTWGPALSLIPSWPNALSNQVLPLSLLISVPFLGTLPARILQLLSQIWLWEISWCYWNSGYLGASHLHKIILPLPFYFVSWGTGPHMSIFLKESWRFHSLSPRRGVQVFSILRLPKLSWILCSCSGLLDGTPSGFRLRIH